MTIKPIKNIYKQDQGSKAPLKDHPNCSFMTRLDYRRLKETMCGLSRLQSAWLLDMIFSIYLKIHSFNLMFHSIHFIIRSIYLIRLYLTVFNLTRLQNAWLLDILLHLYRDSLVQSHVSLHQSQGDYPNRSFLTRHDLKWVYLAWLDYEVLDMICSIYIVIHSSWHDSLHLYCDSLY